MATGSRKTRRCTDPEVKLHQSCSQFHAWHRIDIHSRRKAFHGLWAAHGCTEPSSSWMVNEVKVKIGRKNSTQGLEQLEEAESRLWEF